ncbi:MAG: rhodanese-like domain-containing protein [Bacteriovoracaceae bacterium]|jgi:rhodanese-related sulfurtransferase|nr:rhodanese-like domain-containing protein [Bacteriovoracaceae bacterium]
MEIIKKYYPFLIISFFITYKIYKNRKAKNMAKELIQQNAVLIDVRNPEEFAQSNVKNSINIPLANISTIFNQYPKNQKIAFFCASGLRSKMAISIMKNQGFTDVHNLISWKNINS